GHDRAFAAGNESHGDPAFAHETQAMAVQRVKAFEGFAAVAVPEAAVGQDAVDIERHETDFTCAFCNGLCGTSQYEGFGGMGGSHGHGQITFAASRSCMCSAPSSRPS